MHSPDTVVNMEQENAGKTVDGAPLPAGYREHAFARSVFARLDAACAPLLDLLDGGDWDDAPRAAAVVLSSLRAALESARRSLAGWWNGMDGAALRAASVEVHEVRPLVELLALAAPSLPEAAGRAAEAAAAALVWTAPVPAWLDTDEESSAALVDALLRDAAEAHRQARCTDLAARMVRQVQATAPRLGAAPLSWAEAVAVAEALARAAVDMVEGFTAAREVEVSRRDGGVRITVRADLAEPVRVHALLFAAAMVAARHPLTSAQGCADPHCGGIVVHYRGEEPAFSMFALLAATGGEMPGEDAPPSWHPFGDSLPLVQERIAVQAAHARAVVGQAVPLVRWLVDWAREKAPAYGIQPLLAAELLELVDAGRVRVQFRFAYRSDILGFREDDGMRGLLSSAKTPTEKTLAMLWGAGRAMLDESARQGGTHPVPAALSAAAAAFALVGLAAPAGELVERYAQGCPGLVAADLLELAALWATDDDPAKRERAALAARAHALRADVYLALAGAHFDLGAPHQTYSALRRALEAVVTSAERWGEEGCEEAGSFPDSHAVAAAELAEALADVLAHRQSPSADHASNAAALIRAALPELERMNDAALAAQERRGQAAQGEP